MEINTKKEELKRARLAINIWLRSNDWIVNKVFLGEWSDTDERFLEYKRLRAIKRYELDLLNKKIEKL